MKNSDLDVIERIRKGDAAAFNELILTYQQKVYNLCLRMTSKREDALDLSQEIFIKVYRSLDSFKGDSAFSTWLYRIAMNVCIDDARRKKTMAQETSLSYSDGEDSRDLDLPDMRNNPETEFFKAETARLVREYIGKLSDEHRQVLLLREISGLSYAEISDVLGIEEGTVKSRISRARENLRQLLTSSGNFFVG